MANDSAHFSIGEVVFLLSISRDEAIHCDADPRSWLSRLSPDGPSISTGSSDGPPVPVIARWQDVQRARRLVRSRHDQALLSLRAEDCLSTEQAAEALGMSVRAAQYRLRSTVELILDELGGMSDVEEFERSTELVERVLRAWRR